MINPFIKPGFYLSFALIFIILLNACSKERFTDDASVKLAFETDTITFDTVFTTVGSTTEFFKIYNEENRSIRTNVYLGGGESSIFRINVNGVPTTNASDVEVGANDSLYVFVEVTVNPNQDDLPFLVTDSIMFETNGNFQKIDLVAYGQNANFFSDVLICDETFTNEKPYLLYNDIVIDEGCTLTIKEGVRIHMHPRSNIYVLGSLIIEGTKDSMVTFQGDRLEDFYDDLPSQWNGIYVLRGSEADINYADINESNDGIVVGFPFISEEEITDDRTPQLTIRNSSIRNCLSRNILGLRADITAENCQFSNSNLYNIELAHGGNYDFTHCTLVNYGVGSINHRNPILRLANYASLGETIFAFDQVNANFTNCIIHGSEDEEILFDDDIIEQASAINYEFRNCLLKTEFNIDSIGFFDCIKNPASADTLFRDRNENDFHLNNESPAINAGTTTNILTDFDGIARDEFPDIGCYEFVE